MSFRAHRVIRRATSLVINEALESRRLLCGIPHEQWIPAPIWDAALERNAVADHEAGGDAGTADIVWANRGAASDRFAEVFGTSAGAARSVVDAVIASWENVITDWNRADGTTTLQLNIAMHSSNTGFGAAGGPGATPADGKPRTGSITINRGSNAAGDPNDANGFYLDPDPFDNDAFQGDIINAFAGAETVGIGADFFSLVSAEIAHTLGLIADKFNDGDDYQGYKLENFVTNTGVRDSAEGGGSFGFYYVFDGPTIDHLMTSYNSGDQTSTSWGNAVHTAGGTANINYDSKNWRGSEDSGNASYGNERTLPSYVMANILKDAYGYSIVQPDRFGTFYTVFDQSTGNVNVRGGDFHVGHAVSNDKFYVSVDGSDMVISVDVPTDVPGTYALSGGGDFPAWTTRIPLSSVNTITINAEDGDDDIFVYGVPSGVTVVVNGGNGNDFVQIGDGDIDDASTGIQGNVTVNGGAGTDGVSYFDFSDNVGNDLYTVTSNSITKTGAATMVYNNADVEEIDVSANPFDNTFDVNSLGTFTDITLLGLGGNDTFRFDVDFDLIDNFITCTGGNGEDTVTINDSLDAGADDYLISGNRFEKVVGTGAVVLTSSTENLDVTANDDANGINIPQLSSWMNVTVRGGDGADAFTVANSNISGNILGTVSVQGGLGVDSLVVSDALDAGDDNYNFTNVRIDKGGASFIGYATMETLLLTLNGGGNDITLLSTHSSTSTTINGGNGDDNFRVNDGSSSFLFNFGGDVTLNGGAGTDSVTMTDAAFAGVGNYTISNGHIVAPFNGFDVFHNTTESVSVNGSKGINTFNIDQASVQTIVTGDDGDDTFNVGNGNFDANITALLLIGGGAGDDLVIVKDQLNAAANTWTISNSGVAKDSTTTTLPVNFLGPLYERLQIDAGGGASTFNLTALGASTSSQSVSVNGGAGNDTMNVSPASGSISGSFFGSIGFDGQGGTQDALNVNDLADTGNDTTTITPSAITKSDWAGNSLTYAGNEAYLLNASNVASTITMTGSPVSAASFRINANGGDDAVNITGNALGTTIDVSTGAATVADSLSVNSDGAGSATARVVDLTDTLSTLTIGAGGKLIVPQNGNAVIKITAGANISGGIDLADNALIRSGAVQASYYYDRLANGFGNGTWTGAVEPYIHSTVANATTRSDGIGHGLGSAIVPTSLNGLSIAPGDTVLRYTLGGDVNLNRLVDFDDLLKLAQNYGPTTGGKTWTDGNFDYNTADSVAGSVGFNDLLALAQNYNLSVLTTLPTSTPSVRGTGLSTSRADTTLANRKKAETLFGEVGI